ncbi:MAG: hypothetical protein QF380_05640, partial [Candidatus Marinimicrobia bacterium]|nr:hypothetical protein [Candidatus Neomarinimicrobiota bacterium]
GSDLVDDECGVCGGDGIAEGACDCAGNVDLGCGCGEAGPSGCDEICGSDLELDECGVCGGDGPEMCWDGSYVCDTSNCPDAPDGWDGDACSMPDHSIHITSGGSVLYHSSTSIAGFQFDVDGTIVTGASGGDFGQCQSCALQTSDPPNPPSNTVVGYVFGSFPAGSGILTNLTVTIDTSAENICLQNVLISETGVAPGEINSCPKYWQLTCIPIP